MQKNETMMTLKLMQRKVQGYVCRKFSRRLHVIPTEGKTNPYRRKNTEIHQSTDTKIQRGARHHNRAVLIENDKAPGIEGEIKKYTSHIITLQCLTSTNAKMFSSTYTKDTKKGCKSSRERYEDAANCQGTSHLRNYGAKRSNAFKCISLPR